MSDIHERETERAFPASQPVPPDDLVDEHVVVDLAAWTREREEANRKAEQRLVSVDERGLEKLHRARIMLAALVRKTGRVRISRSDLDSITPASKLDVKVQPSGDLVVTFVEGR